MFARKAVFAALFTLTSTLLVPSSRAALPPPAGGHTVGGLISGLTGSRLILQNNNRDDLEINANGAFIFRTALPADSVYNVTIKQQPSNPAQNCTVLNGAGVVGSVNVTTVQVQCAAVVSQVTRFVYVSSAFENTVSTYAVDAATGRLRPRGYVHAPLDTVSADGATSQSAGFVIDPSGRFAYAANQPAHAKGWVTAFRIDAVSGTLTRLPVTGLPFANNLTGIAVDPRGRFVYVSQFQNDLTSFQGYVTAYAIDQASGALTRIGDTPFPAGMGSAAIAVEQTGHFVYVVNAVSADLSIFSIDQTSGALTEMARVATGDGPTSIAIDSRGRFLYVTNGNTNTVSIFAINTQTGALTAAGTPVATGSAPAFIAIDSSGQRAYVANTGSDNVSAYQVNPTTGALTEVAGSPFPTLHTPSRISIDPSGGFVRVTHVNVREVATFAVNPSTGGLLPLASDAIVRARTGFTDIATFSGPKPVVIKPKLAYVSGNLPGFGGGQLFGYTVDAQSGALAPVANSPFPWTGGPGSMATDVAGRFNYVVRWSLFDAYSINAATGALTTIEGSPYDSGWISPADVAIEPSGRFLYAANSGIDPAGPPRGGTVSSFRIETNGSLTALEGPRFTAGLNTTALTVGPNGRWLYTAEALSNTITIFEIDRHNGHLFGVFGSPVATGRNPGSVNAEASGRYVYVTTSDGIYAYTLNPQSGALTSVSGSPFASGGTNPSSLATDPFGRFAYVVNSFSNNLTAFRINTANGALIAIAGGSYPLGSGAARVSVDPSGQFVYVTNMSSDNVFAFAIEPTTGALRTVQGSPYSTGRAGAAGIAITGTIE